ncbi:hypothetical protein DVR14_00500 (plasmid) [Natrinema thermotolerans]|nr:hypothetical protein DVR14_00500 [Natrinema thermotolerans]
MLTERVDAKQQSRADPATIRASGSPNSMTGTYAVTGENLAGARLESSGGTLEVTAIAEDSDGPGELNVKPSNAMTGRRIRSILRSCMARVNSRSRRTSRSIST